MNCNSGASGGGSAGGDHGPPKILLRSAMQHRLGAGCQVVTQCHHDPVRGVAFWVVANVPQRIRMQLCTLRNDSESSVLELVSDLF